MRLRLFDDGGVVSRPGGGVGDFLLVFLLLELRLCAVAGLRLCPVAGLRLCAVAGGETLFRVDTCFDTFLTLSAAGRGAAVFDFFAVGFEVVALAAADRFEPDFVAAGVDLAAGVTDSEMI